MAHESVRLAIQAARRLLFTQSSVRLDDKDVKLLRLLAEGARESIKALAERISLSPSGTLNRLHRLEEAGVILRYRADIDDGLFEDWQVYWVDLMLTPKGRAQLDTLQNAMRSVPEIMEATEAVDKYPVTLRVALHKPTDWTAIQDRIDPSRSFIESVRLRAIGRTLKPASPHPLLIAD